MKLYELTESFAELFSQFEDIIEDVEAYKEENR